MSTRLKAALWLATAILGSVPLQAGDGPEEGMATAEARVPEKDSVPAVDDVAVDRAEPDFVVITLPTTLRLPRHRTAFRVTHRFDRALGEGDFGDLAADFFGFDAGATIGLEFRFSLFTGTDLGFYRTSERTIRFFGQQEVVRQGSSPLGISVTAGVEGLDNFQEEYSPQVGVILSRKLGTRGALYAVPQWIGNTRRSPASGDDSTILLGLGVRILVRESVALVAEWAPRLGGFRGDRGGQDAESRASFGIEKRVGGHAFQFNFSNDLGTTPAEAARGKQGADGWFLGFNISRKFY